eukprot:scaffold56460_cov45-Phaeocystis_antarctica.AAC.1
MAAHRTAREGSLLRLGERAVAGDVSGFYQEAAQLLAIAMSTPDLSYITSLASIGSKDEDARAHADNVGLW